MELLNNKSKKLIIKSRILWIFLCIVFSYQLFYGIYLLIKSWIIVGSIMVGMALIIILFIIIMIEFVVVRNKFIVRVEIKRKSIILKYLNPKKVIDVPFSKIKKRKIAPQGAIQYYTQIKTNVSFGFPNGLISSTLFDDEINKEIDKRYKEYEESKG